MNNEFELLREVLSGQRLLPVDVSLAEACNRRLLRAAMPGHVCRPGEADLAVLTRHALRREQEKQAGVSPTVAVPRTAPWPSPATWELFGVDVMHATPTHIHLRSCPWTPAWLPDAGRYPLDEPAAAEEHRRDYGEPLSGDPFLDPFEAWRSYRCAGQKEAVRGVLMAPGGSTLVVNLPTGSGKSLCAYIPALIDPAGLTVVVVPTTTLALDQERALAAHVLHPTAYHGGADATTKERNQGIRERIRGGTQRILFTSPESLIQSLAGPLYTAANQGSLRLLAVDEAHIIDQWGDDFRFQFQELAGLRQDLLRQSRGETFKTVLLTGTMTEACLDILETLFGRPGPFSVLSAVQIRPEPAYWLVACPDEDTRRERVFEALRHLPRPLILYVTKVADANAWLERLHAAGFRRAAAVTGGTKPNERAQVVRNWQDENLDLIVATSAFGLGMDKGDVRAVIHACIPEHIDRYYQEVGRGGRDGRASVSLLLHTPQDEVTARRLSSKTLITTEEDKENKGYERWKAMFHRSDDLHDGRVRVKIDEIPEYGFARFAESESNEEWNVQTLVLLALAGIIELDAQPPPQRSEFLDDDGVFDEELFRGEFERHRRERVLCITNELHLDLAKTWYGTVEEARKKSKRASRRGFDLMLEALRGTQCLADGFGDAYEISPREGDQPRQGSVVSLSCGGCPACRRAGRPTFAGAMPTPPPAWLTVRKALPEELARLLGTAQEAVLFDDLLGRAGGSDRQRRERLLRYLVAKGMRSIVAPLDELDRLRPLFRTSAGPPVFFDEEWQPLRLPRLPAVIVRPSTTVLATLLTSVGRVPGFDPPRILWLAADTRDPEKPHCLLAHTVQGPSYRLEEFCTRVGV